MPGFYDYYDVAVVGAGHAGIEAALASARMGLKTVLITQTPDSIARMSCNPSIGGIAKGNIVREIDALGGEMGKLIDRSMIQFRMLNKRRGPAVQAPRSQADKITYSRLARQVCEQTENLYTLMDTVIDILTTASETPLPPNSDSAADKGTIPGEKRGYSGSNIENPDYATEAARSGMRQKVTGVVTERGRIIPVRSVVLTTGTFLGGRIFIGEYDAPCGRVGEPAAYGLTASLHRLGFTTGRLKTGTPPRILKRTIDFDKLELEPGDEEVIPFSFEDEKIERPMVPCHIVYTNEETHKIIRDNIGRSPLYSGKISGIGPRYCPSIEDKVMRFKERDRHQIFVEPEGLETEEPLIRALVNPPLRADEDCDMLIEALRDGTIDVISTDHAPHTMEDKAAGSPGFTGLETAFAVCNTVLVKNNDFAPQKLSQLMSANPARILGLTKGLLKSGYTADLTLVDTEEEWVVDSRLFCSKGKATPFEGKELTGKVKGLFLAGRKVFER